MSKDILKALQERGEVCLWTWVEGCWQGMHFLEDHAKASSDLALAQWTALKIGSGRDGKRKGWAQDQVEAAKNVLNRYRQQCLHQSVDESEFQESHKRTLIRCAEGTFFHVRLQRKDRLILLGAGHVARAVAQLLSGLDFEYYLCDPREDWTDPHYFPNVKEIFNMPYTAFFEIWKSEPHDYYLILTPGHRDDTECALRALQNHPYYVGMIGSRAKVCQVKERLISAGITEKQMQKLHAPVGLPIGGQTPAEIAVSIAAELIQQRHQTEAYFMDQSVYETLQQGISLPFALVSIVEKRGSTPRDVGACMLVSKDGSLLAGTIGGGAEERAAQDHAQWMMENQRSFSLQYYNLSHAAAADLGMICGGQHHVFFEVFQDD